MKPANIPSIFYVDPMGGAESSYAVTRMDENTYKLSLNPNFYNLERSKSLGKKTERVRVKYPGGEESVARCFAWFNETYGKDMQPKLVFELSEVPRAVNIRVNPDKDFRSNSKEYAFSDLVDCAVVIHESLHLMGLVDEYSENQRETFRGGRAYDCRSTSDSIMSAHYIYSFKGLFSMSPLRPAHLRKLIFPHCAEANALYDACAKNAYRSSTGFFRGCADVPPECAVRNGWLD